MAITPQDLGGDEDLARRILVRARALAPCIDGFEKDTEKWKDAVAILRGVAQVAASPARTVASQSRNGTSISFRDIKSAFSDEDVSGLRSLCGGPDTSLLPGLPRGSFPKDRPLEKVWPEGPYS